jgi:hypothetical protein
MFGSATNQNGSYSVTSNLIRIVGGSNILFDDASINVLYLTQSAFSSNYIVNPAINDNYGYRVTSGAGLYPTVLGEAFGNFGLLFNNNSNLLAGTYSNELQLTNGFFTSFVGGTSYLDYRPYYNPIPSTYSYPNYTTVNTGQMRYTTFMWYISSESLGGNEAFIGQFIIENNNFISTIDGNGFSILNNVTTQFMLFNPTDNSKNTAWLNANAYTNTLRKNNSLTNGQARGIYDSVIYPADNFNRYVFFADNQNSSLPPFILYFRIGIPVNSGLFFNSCKLVNIFV